MKSKLELDKEFEAMIAVAEDVENDLETRINALSVLKKFAVDSETSQVYSSNESLAIYAIVGELENSFLELEIKN